MQNFTERVVSALSSGKAEFIVVGGVSAVLQGAPIVTRDLDLCYRRTSDNYRRLAEALSPFQLRCAVCLRACPTSSTSARCSSA